MKKLFILFLFSSIAISSFSKEKRDILQKEARVVEIEKVLIKDFSDLGFPTYKSRNFWNSLPEEIRTAYIE